MLPPSEPRHENRRSGHPADPTDPADPADPAGESALRIRPKIAAALAAALAAAGAAAGAALLELPGLNGPAEWRWPYRPPGLALWPALAAALFAAALLATLLLGPKGRRGTAWMALWGYGLSLSLVAAQPEGFGRVVRVLASRHSFSYLYDAALAPATHELLADFPAASAALSMHSRTHPPGALLAIRGIDRAARALGPAGALRAPLAQTAEGAMAAEISRARERGKPVPAHAPSPLSAVALAFLLPLAAALAALPLFSLGRDSGLSDLGARSAAAIWLTVPAGILFTPSLDQALAGVTALGAALAAGSRGPEPTTGRWKDLRIAGAGIVLALGCLISYGLLVAVPFVAWVAFSAPEGSFRQPRRFVRAALVGAGFVLPWLLLALFAGYDPWQSFRAAISAHGQMAVASRSYATWLLANPFDFALLCGPAAAVLGAVGLFSRQAPQPLRRTLRGGAALFALLWLSGSVRGEVGRIWLFAMPFVALLAAAALEESDPSAPPDPWPPGLVVAAQALVAIALAASMIFVD